MLLLALLACSVCGDDPWDRFLAVNVVGLERPAQTTLSVDLGREHYDCVQTFEEGEDGDWEQLAEDCPGATGAYWVEQTGEIGLVLPVHGTPARASVEFEAVGEDGVPYGFTAEEDRIDWERTGAVCRVQGHLWYAPDGRMPQLL